MVHSLSVHSLADTQATQLGAEEIRDGIEGGTEVE